jgi:hypothetical protein
MKTETSSASKFQIVRNNRRYSAGSYILVYFNTRKDFDETSDAEILAAVKAHKHYKLKELNDVWGIWRQLKNSNASARVREDIVEETPVAPIQAEAPAKVYPAEPAVAPKAWKSASGHDITEIPGGYLYRGAAAYKTAPDEERAGYVSTSGGYFPNLERFLAAIDLGRDLDLDIPSPGEAAPVRRRRTISDPLDPDPFGLVNL